MTGSIKAVLFDAYGTLFDFHQPIRDLANEIGEIAHSLSRMWRDKQIENSMRRTLMEAYVDFWWVTEEALDYALAAHGIADEGLRERLLQSYQAIQMFADAPGALAALQHRNLPVAILTNGTVAMVEQALAATGQRDKFDAILSADAVGQYKPASAVYRLGVDRFGLPAANMLFISANGWDAAGAANYGYTTVWLNRMRQVPERLPGTPVAVIGTLDDLPAVVDSLGSGS